MKKIQRYREIGYQWWEGQYRGKGDEKGYYGIIWNHVCDTSENCKALQNANNLLIFFLKQMYTKLERKKKNRQ